MRKVVAFAAFLAVVALLLIAKAPARATMQETGWYDAAARQELTDFQQFLTNHPWIAKKLRANPSLANSQDFLNENPELPKFLNAHPYVQSGLKTDAGGFMRREQEFETSPPPPMPSQPQESWDSGDYPANRAEIRDFQQFLADHSWIARSLQEDPSLANNQDFLNGNPLLTQFLRAHP